MKNGLILMKRNTIEVHPLQLSEVIGTNLSKGYSRPVVDPGSDFKIIFLLLFHFYSKKVSK